MARNMSDKVLQGLIDGRLKVNEDEIRIFRDIVAKYNTNSDTVHMIHVILQLAGFGRNNETSNALRAAADIIDSPITTCETSEAILDGKLQ